MYSYYVTCLGLGRREIIRRYYARSKYDITLYYRWSLKVYRRLKIKKKWSRIMSIPLSVVVLPSGAANRSENRHPINYII